MNTSEILEMFKDYLENEYREVVSILTRDKLPRWVDNPNQIKKVTLERCLGAAMCIRHLGVPSKEVNEAYETFMEAIEAIVPTKEREVRK